MHVLRERVVIQTSYIIGKYNFFSREQSVYFNIKDERSVIQISLKEGEGNLLYNYLFSTACFSLTGSHCVHGFKGHYFNSMWAEPSFKDKLDNVDLDYC